MNRKQYVQDQLNLSDSEIKRLPVACKKSFKSRCTTRDLTATGKKVLKEAGVDERELTYIELNKDKMDMVIYEKAPTAYLLRRNFGTMMRLIDLTQNEMEYIIGHNITSIKKTRNYFTNPDILHSIKLKMDNRPYFSSEYPVDKGIIMESEKTVQIDSPYKQSITISPNDKKRKVIMELQSKNPDDKIDVSFYTDSEEPLKVEMYSTAVQRNKSNDLSVLSLIHKEYDAAE